MTNSQHMTEAEQFPNLGHHGYQALNNFTFFTLTLHIMWVGEPDCA